MVSDEDETIEETVTEVSKDKKSDITIDFSALVGFPKVYAFYCMDNTDCYFDKEYFNEKNHGYNNCFIVDVFC